MTEAPKKDSLADYEKWSARQLITQLQIELRIMQNRKMSGEAFKADEVTVTVSREHYEKLCRLALDRAEFLLRKGIV